jgi:hypothetical protein
MDSMCPKASIQKNRRITIRLYWQRDLNLVGNIVIVLHKRIPNVHLIFQRNYVGHTCFVCLKTAMWTPHIILKSDCISSPDIYLALADGVQMLRGCRSHSSLSRSKECFIDELRNESFICVSRMEDPSIYDK